MSEQIAKVASDPYSLFVYGMRSPMTREKYVPRLRKFFDCIGIQGPMEERCQKFVDSVRAQGNDWLITILLQFFQSQKERVERKEIAATTLRNYVKTIKLFLEMSDISIPWKKITRGLPKGRRFAIERACQRRDMSRANLIYDFEGRIKRELKNIKNADRLNSEYITKYHLQRIADGVGLARQHKCLCTVKQISKMLNRRFQEATKDDIVNLVAEIEQRQDFSAWTKRDYKIILKLFYRWLYGCEKGEHPPQVKWIRAGYKVPNKLKKSDLLTASEIVKIAHAANNPRDKALILVLAESGRRLGEILTLRIGDIEFDRLGARLLVEGKMGQDYSRVIRSARQLAAWLKIHPDRSNPDSPVWVRWLDRKEVKQMHYDIARGILQDCVERAGISKEKRVWFYLFRHSRGTFASTKLNAQQLCALMGWKQGSHMASVYIHLAAEDVDAAQAILNGINVKL